MLILISLWKRQPTLKTMRFCRSICIFLFCLFVLMPVKWRLCWELVSYWFHHRFYWISFYFLDKIWKNQLLKPALLVFLFAIFGRKTIWKILFLYSMRQFPISLIIDFIGFGPVFLKKIRKKPALLVLFCDCQAMD